METTVQFPETDLVLANLLLNFELEDLRRARLVNRRWEGFASAALAARPRSQPGGHQAFVLHLNAEGKAEKRFSRVARFFGDHRIHHTLALSLRRTPWRKRDSYPDERELVPVDPNWEARHQDLTHSFFSSPNLDYTRILGASAVFDLVTELHLEIALKSRADSTVFWRILGQFPAATYLSLTFPIILHVALEAPGIGRKQDDEWDLVAETCGWVKALCLRDVQVEGACLRVEAWEGFLMHFPNVVSLYLNHGFYLGIHDYMDSTLTTLLEACRLPSVCSNLASVQWLWHPIRPRRNWEALNNLSAAKPKLTCLQFGGSTEFLDIPFAELTPDLKAKLRVLNYFFQRCAPELTVRPDLHLNSQPFSNLVNLSLAWVGHLWADHPHFLLEDLKTMFRTEAFESLFPSLRALSLLPFEDDPIVQEEVWAATIFSPEGNIYRRIRALAVPLGFRPTDRLGLIRTWFPDLLELRHLTPRRRVEGNPSGKDELLWICTHRWWPQENSSDASLELRMTKEEFPATKARVTRESEISWYDVRELLPHLTFKEGCKGFQHPWKHQRLRGFLWRHKPWEPRRKVSRCRVV